MSEPPLSLRSEFRARRVLRYAASGADTHRMQARSRTPLRCVAFTAAVPLIEFGPEAARGVLVLAATLTAAGATVAGPRGRPAPWGRLRLPLAVSQVLFGIVFAESQLDRDATALLDGSSGWVTAAAVIVLAVTVIAIGRSAGAVMTRQRTIDTATVAVSCGSVFWVTNVGSRSLGGGDVPLQPWLPVVIAVIAASSIAALIQLGGTPRVQRPGAIRLAAGVIAVNLAQVVEGLWSNRSTMDTSVSIPNIVSWALLLVFLISTTSGARRPLPPSPWLDPNHEPESDEVPTSGFVAILACTLLVPVAGIAWGEGPDQTIVAVSTVLLLSLLLIRMSMLVDSIVQTREQLLRDPLTGLANRTLFADRANHLLRQRSRPDITVMFIDVDDFKTVNDSLGHQAGDDLLMTVAARLQDCAREGDTVARLGGDEFGVMLEGVVDREVIVAKARRILDAISRPMHLNEHAVQVGASIGIAVRSDETPDSETLLRGADLAMYLAKSQGKGRFEFFDRSMHEAVVDRLNLKADLKEALERHQFEVHYQPVIDIADQRLESVEALLRWHHPVRGLVPPDVFIPLAEETGLIVPIGRWVLAEACRQAREWQALGPQSAQLGIGVNLSVRQMNDPDLLSDISAILESSGLESRHLVMELTESMLMEDSELAASRLREMKRLGVRIAIDDFGTGYSSLGYLRNFPVDLIKIDRSFVSELCGSEKADLLVRTVVDLTAALGASAIAEGIESFDQFERLHRLGCTFGQGYLISKPLTAASMTTLLSKGVGTAVFDIHPRDREGSPMVPEQETPKSSRSLWRR